MTELADAAVQAAMDAAAATLAQPAELVPAGVYQAHQCQTDCGRLADVIVVRLEDSDTDMLCNICHLTMMMAIAQAIPAPDEIAQPGETGDNSASTQAPAPAPE